MAFPPSKPSKAFQIIYGLLFLASLAFYAVSMEEVHRKYNVRSEPSKNMQWSSFLLLLTTLLGVMSINSRAIMKNRYANTDSWRVVIALIVVTFVVLHTVLGLSIGAHTGPYPEDDWWYKKDVLHVAWIVPIIVAGLYFLIWICTLTGWNKNLPYQPLRDGFNLEYWKGSQSAAQQSDAVTA